MPTALDVELSQCSFWMDGLLAEGAVEISHDPSDLDREGFWAALATFEGEWTCIRFEQVQVAPFPPRQWRPTKNEWRSSFTRSEYIQYVEEIRDFIGKGEVYQVNACRTLKAEHDGNLEGLFSEILSSHPAPYAAYFKSPLVEVASASPELFLHIENGVSGRFALSSPIKGTSSTPYFGQKDSAENVMIVDLIRNDLGQICIPGSIDVPRLLATESHPGLFHLVSDVTGNIKEEVRWSDISRAMLPAGSISGAPKSSALKIIQEKEREPRGPYCGAIGWVNGESARFSVGIRLFYKTDDSYIRFGTGAGITWASDAASEWDETELKARRLIALANGVAAHD